MVDFAAVLKNTIDGLGDFSPAVREIVYQRARAALAARLAAVGPPPTAVAERQRRALEDAIAEVESSYSDEVDDDPIAELANIFDQARKPAARETTALDIAPSTEGPDPTLQAEGRAAKLPEPPAPMNAAAANDAGQARDLMELATPADPRKPSEPTIVEAADFQVLGEASAAFGNELAEVQATDGNTMDFGPIRLNTLTMESVHQLGWGSSGLCGLCQRWAVCVDQRYCWHRTTLSE